MTNDALSQANIDRFNEIAATWDDRPGRTQMASAIARAILAALPESGGGNALEFGCGTGLITALLAPRCSRVIAMDSSPGMLGQIHEKIRKLNLNNVETFEGDLSETLPPGPFNTIFSSMTLHHIPDVEGLFARLHGQLEPQGMVALADLDKEDGSFHGDMPGIAHKGFERPTVQQWLEKAGFQDIQFVTAYEMEKTGDDGISRKFPIFLVTARKP